MIKHLIVSAILASTAIVAQAQQAPPSPESFGDIEYMAAGASYDSAFGLGIYKFNPNGVGFYGNLFASGSSKRQPHYSSLTVTSFGDPVTRRYKDLTMLNVGITKSISSNIGMYAGIGYASSDGQAQKYDPLRILGSDGYYYVNDSSNNKSGANLNAGVVLGIGNVALNVGYHSFTGRASVGLGIRF